MKKLSTREIKQFQKIILDHYHTHGRHDLPWRKKSRTPYHVLVSEIMLQQTQVDRVIPFFKTWMKSFPTFASLAAAGQSTVLKHWKGLGYNSRALRLHKLAKQVTDEYRGRLPQSRPELETLPGIGPYTAGAIRVFAFEEPDVFIETNIRRIFIHHFFSKKHDVTDAEILELVEKTLPKKNVFDWYSALMDYGSTLPKILKKNPNTKSKHYTKQSKFEGSDRQIRGRILDLLLSEGSLTKKKLFSHLGEEHERYEIILNQLKKEGFLKKKGARIELV